MLRGIIIFLFSVTVVSLAYGHSMIWAKIKKLFATTPAMDTSNFPSKEEMANAHKNAEAKHFCHDKRCPAYTQHKCHDMVCQDERRRRA